jgi:hypothetical protein
MPVSIEGVKQMRLHLWKLGGPVERHEISFCFDIFVGLLCLHARIGFIRNLAYIMTTMGRTFFSNLLTTLDMQFSIGTYFNADFMYYSVSGNREFTYVRRQRQDDGYQYNVINPIAQKKLIIKRIAGVSDLSRFCWWRQNAYFHVL